MKNVIMALYAELWISMYPFRLLITEIWDYKHANAENIQKAISMFYWQKAFKNKNTNEMTRLLTDTVMNIFKHFIPHKSKKFECKHPESMNSFIISSHWKEKHS